ncbi:MAG: RluA family pseudouridine synthase [Verrucomicrobiia bacterium]|jgi:23S rRNA pseudouridine1911/1915/1917 synthase
MVENLFICPDGKTDRVDKILAQAFPEVSRSHIQKAIEEKKVRRKDGSTLIAKTKIRTGDELWIDLSREDPAPLIARDIPIDVLFQDDEILVINKASGMVVHPGDGTKDDTLIHALLYHYPGCLCPIGAPERPGIVHRLDKETSGVMVVAKSERAYYSLVDQFSQRKTGKEYFALVFGFLPSTVGKVDQPIGRHPKNRTKMAVVEHGKPALTEWETITQYKDPFSLLRVKIHTGRTHQIRVHLSYLGHPLAGDSTYGATKHPAFSRVMLHAHCLKFTHPISNQELTFTAELPKDFQTSLELLSNN